MAERAAAAPVRIVLRVPAGCKAEARAAARRAGIPNEVIDAAMAEGGAALRTEHLSPAEIGGLVAELADSTSWEGLGRLQEPRYVQRRRARRELVLFLEELIARHGLTLSDVVSVAAGATSAVVDRLFVAADVEAGGSDREDRA